MTAQSTDSRERLLDVAFKEMHQNGFAGANLASISKGANVTKGALFHYFPTKKALLLSVVEEPIRKLLERRWIVPLRDSQDPIATIKAILNGFAAKATCESLRHGCPLQNLTIEVSALDEDFRLHLSELFNRWIEVLEATLLKGIKSGKIRRQVKPRKASLFIIGSFYGAVTLGKTYQSVDFFKQCLSELGAYIESLAMSPTKAKL